MSDMLPTREFDISSLLADLAHADPWIEPFAAELDQLLHAAIGEHDPADHDIHLHLGTEFARVRRTATQARAEKGLLAWNAWAQAIGTLRRAASGHDAARRIVHVVGTADFRDVVFRAPADFACWHFAANADFRGAIFEDYCWFNGALFAGDADFRRAKFSVTASFETASFLERADFSSTVFSASALFRSAKFLGPAVFSQAEFKADVWFRGSDFHGPLEFREAVVAGEAGLGAANYGADADFSSATFTDNAGFENASFAANVVFDRAVFNRAAWFTDTQFAIAPSFNSVRVAEPARFHWPEGVPLPSPARAQLNELRDRLSSWPAS